MLWSSLRLALLRLCSVPAGTPTSVFAKGRLKNLSSPQVSIADIMTLVSALQYEEVQ